MTCCNLYVSGRVVWAGDLKTTKSNAPMRSVVVATSDDDSLPAIMVTIIGGEAEHVSKGSWFGAEGSPELEIIDRDGTQQIRWRMLAYRKMLSGADQASYSRAKAAEKGQKTKAGRQQARRQTGMDFNGASQANGSQPGGQPPGDGPPGPEPPPMDDFQDGEMIDF